MIQNVRAKLALADNDLDGADEAISSALTDRRDAQNIALAIRVLIARGEAAKLTVGQARAQVRLLAKELMELDELQMIVELSQRYPQYFD